MRGIEMGLKYHTLLWVCYVISMEQICQKINEIKMNVKSIKNGKVGNLLINKIKKSWRKDVALQDCNLRTFLYWWQ